MCEIKRASTNFTLDEALDESFLRELSILKMYPSKKPKTKKDVINGDEYNKKKDGGIVNRIKVSFDITRINYRSNNGNYGFSSHHPVHQKRAF